jgi:phospholipase/lecithinase/hemolysin
MVVFGDSLSDNGNAGRFSNGPVWVEQLARRLGLPLVAAIGGGTNYAVGGARLDPASGPYSLRAQADLFLRQRPRTGRTLFVVFGGGNDLLAAVSHPEAERLVDAAVASLRSIVADLVRADAQDLLVPNLPDVGMTPQVRSFGREAMEQAARLSLGFNRKADQALDAVAGAGALRIGRLDVHAMAERARQDPAAYGFRDVTTPCQDRRDCAGYLFWDGVHPTTEAHGRLADAAFQLVSSAGQEQPR